MLPSTLESKLIIQPSSPLCPPQFYNIPAVSPFSFPLPNSSIDSAALIEQYHPLYLNKYISGDPSPLSMTMDNETVCILKGNSLLVGSNSIKVEGITAYTCKGSFVLAAFENKTMAMYGEELKMLKEISNFSDNPIKEMCVVSIYDKKDGFVLITSSGTDLTVRKVEKGIFSSWSGKNTKVVCQSTMHFQGLVDLSSDLKTKYLQKKYPSFAFVCCISPSQIVLVKVDCKKGAGDNFVEVVFTKVRTNPSNLCSASWGQTIISTDSKNTGDTTLVLTYSFGKDLFHLIPEGLTDREQPSIQWKESPPLQMQKSIILCQYIKPHQLLLVHQNGVLNFVNTNQTNILSLTPTFDTIEYSFPDRIKHKPSTLDKTPLKNYFSTSFYQEQLLEVYYLTSNSIAVYRYCPWNKIGDHLKQQNNLEGTMKLLVALHSGATKYSMGLKGTEKCRKDLKEYIHKTVIEYVHTRFPKYQDMEEAEVMTKLIQEEWLIKELTMPVELLVRTQEYEFLFEEFKASIKEYISERVFYKILQPFAEYGMIKYIPEGKLRSVFDYYLSNHQSNVVDRLAINFDLDLIEKGIVVHYCLENVLAVSLAFICTRGTQSQFVTPLIKFYGMMELSRTKCNTQKAAMYAKNALWYINLCLERSMVLKQYSQQKYGSLLSILTMHLFTPKVLGALYVCLPQEFLNVLAHYFSLESALVVVEYCTLKNAGSKVDWIKHTSGKEILEAMLSMVGRCVEDAREKRANEEEKRRDCLLLSLFLSRIVVNKTIKFVKGKYLQILEDLINGHTSIRLMDYGHGHSINSQQDQERSQKYINKILMQSIHEVQLDPADLDHIYSLAKTQALIEVQVYIKYLGGQYGQAMDIYLNSSHKDKVYDFILNTFKLLGLEKRKKDKNTVETDVKARISPLISLNPEKTTNIAKLHFPQSQDEFIQALSGERPLQLEYLEELVHSYTRMCEKSVLLFVDLTCSLKPYKMLETIKKYPIFPIEETLRVCEKFKAYDCLQYLYEKMGLSKESIKISIERIQIAIKEAQGDYIASAQQVSNILDSIQHLCVRNRSEELWELLFDSCLALTARHKQNGSWGSIFQKMSCRVFYELMVHCPLEYGLGLIQNKYGHIAMSQQICFVFLDLLRNLFFNENMVYYITRYERNKVFHRQIECCTQERRGFPVSSTCDSCQHPRDKSGKCIVFHCGHTYHQGCVPLDKEDGKICCFRCLQVQENIFQFHSSTLTHRRNKKHRIIQEAKQLREQTLKRFKEEEQQYQVEQLEKEHEKVQSSKLVRLMCYESIKEAGDEISNKVLEQLERSMRVIKQQKN